MPQILRCGFPVMYLIESGEKRYAMIPATVKYLEDEDWATTNFEPTLIVGYLLLTLI